MTEWISLVNIPACQLMVGMGIPLYRISDIRRLFLRDPAGEDPIDFEDDPQMAPSGAILDCSRHCPVLTALLFTWGS